MKNIFLIGAFGLALALRPPLVQAAAFTATSAADAFVASGPSGNLANNNYGGGGALAIAAAGLPNGEFQSVIKFNLGTVASALNAQYSPGQWTIQSVTLQLSSSPHNNAIYNETVPGAFQVSLLQNDSWSEGTGNASNPANNGVTFNSLQNTYVNPASDQALGTFNFPGGTSGLLTYDLALSPQLQSDIVAGGDVSLRLFAADNNVSYLFSSRAANPPGQPTLIVTAVPEPGSWVLLVMGFGALGLWRPRAAGLRTSPVGPSKEGQAGGPFS